jgi:putative restriction endonuclease
MNRKLAIELFSNLGTWKRGSERAPNKPLLILLALAKCAQGLPRLIPYSTVDKELKPLLIEFGPSRKAVHTEYPFWWLQSDKVWQVSSDGHLDLRKGSLDPKKSELLRHHALGGFTTEMYELLRSDSRVFESITTNVLRAHFPSTLHPDIRSALGLPSPESNTRAPRDPDFRRTVLRAYRHECAICGYSLRLENSDVGLEAAHIMWHEAGGPDMVTNGLSLCVMHHKLFDRGAIGLSADRLPRLLVSEHLHGSSGLTEWALQHRGKTINKPVDAEYVPHREFILWHTNQVFRSPALAFDD